MFIQCLPWRGLEKLRMQFAESSAKGGLLFSNFSQYIKAPYHLARDLCQQVAPGSLPQLLKIIEHVHVGKRDYLTNIDRWIDKEAFGKEYVVRAQDAAEFLCDAWKQNHTGVPNLLLFRGREKIGRDTEMILYFMQRNLGSFPVYCLQTEALSPLMLEWEIRDSETCAPSDLYLQLHPEIGGPNTISLAGNNSLQQVTDPAEASRHYYARFLELTQQKIDPQVFQKGFSPAHYFKGQPKEILRMAWRASFLGDYPLAESLALEGYQQSTEASIKEEYLANLQIIRLTHGYFEEAALQEFPKEIHTEKHFRVLWYSKAYCGTITRHLDIAGKGFEALGFSETLADRTVEDVYRLNIYALFQYLSKNVDKAKEIEHIIELRLDALPDPPVQIVYLNSMNQARLFKYQKEYDRSFTYYQKAWKAIEGSLIDYDLIYHPASFARLAEARGDWQEAYDMWVNSALYWSAKRCKEALAFRALGLILGKPVSAKEIVSRERMAQAYESRIRESAAKAGISLPQPSDLPRPIRYLSTCSKPKSEWSVHLLPGKIAVINGMGPSDARVDCPSLNQLLNGILQAAFPEVAPQKGSMWVVDDTYSQGLPLEPTASYTQAFLHGIPTVLVHGKPPPQTPAALESRLNVELSPGIERIIEDENKSLAVYKRYRPDYFLSFKESSLLKHLQENGPVSLQHLLQPGEYNLNLLKKMCFDARLIQFIYSEQNNSIFSELISETASI